MNDDRLVQLTPYNKEGFACFTVNKSAAGNRISHWGWHGRLARRMWHLLFRHGIKAEARESGLWVRCHCGARFAATVVDCGNIFPPWVEDTQNNLQVSTGYVWKTVQSGFDLLRKDT